MKLSHISIYNSNQVLGGLGGFNDVFVVENTILTNVSSEGIFVQLGQFSVLTLRNLTFNQITQKQTTLGLFANIQTSIEDIKVTNVFVPRTSLGPFTHLYGLSFTYLVMSRVLVEN